MTYLQQLVAAVLAESTPTAVVPVTMPLTVGFAELGMTSLAAVTVRNRLQVDLGHKLPATLVLDYPTITTLARYLTQTILPQLASTPDHVPALATSAGKLDLFTADPSAQPAPPPKDSGKADHDIDALSADEIAEKLAAKLGMRI